MGCLYCKYSTSIEYGNLCNCFYSLDSEYVTFIQVIH